MTRTIRQIVKAALTGGLEAAPTIAVVTRIATALVEELRRDGLAIHETRLCVRPKGDPAEMGRAMTTEEARAFLGTGDAEPLQEATA